MQPIQRSHGNTVAKTLIFCLLSLISLASLAAEPSDVFIGLKIDQITGINQKEENFSVVGSLRIDWRQPLLAFEHAPGEPKHRTYTLATFLKLLEEKQIRWPAFTYHNQQGRMDFQNRLISLAEDGTVMYLERFTSTFQAPAFDFRLFPFDNQLFFIHVDSIFPQHLFRFQEMQGFSGLGDQLGEEEWIVTEVNTHLTTHNEFTKGDASRFVLEFHAERHLNYYLMRILIPVLLIITVSWFTFFLQDYTKRIDLAGGNLLLFIAFNFTISSDLPRLGYITLMDTFLVGTFIITALVVLGNVWLRRLENHGKQALARKFDIYAITSYPLAYLLGALTLWLLFFWRSY